MLKLIAFAAFALAQAPAADDWRVAVLEGERGAGRSVVFVDAATVERGAGEVGFRAELREAGEAENLRFSVRADCASHRFGVRELGSDRGLRVIDDPAAAPRQQAGPGTNMFVLIDAVCTGTYVSGAVERDDYARAHFGAR